MKRSGSARPPIVVGVDLSPASRLALARAAVIARQAGGDLHIVHDAGKLPAALRRTLGMVENAGPGALEALADEVRSRGLRVHVSRTELGTTQALASVARETGAPLVVVGSRGRTLPDTVAGSTAERLAATSKLPVLLVRRPARSAYREVVVAADRTTDLSQIPELTALVAPDRPISIVHAYQGPFETTLLFHGADGQQLSRYRASVRKEARRELAEAVTAAGLDPRTLTLRHGDPRVIFQGTPKDALLVLQRGESMLKHAVLGSVTRSVIALCPGDVLVHGRP